MISPDDTIRQVCQALSDSKCIIIEESALGRDAGNSDIISFPITRFGQLLVAAGLEFLLPEDAQIGFHHIAVIKPYTQGGELHFHISPVIGFVASGKGELIYMEDDAEVRKEITKGDIFVFPAEALHVISAELSMPCICVTFEWGLELDYQRHHK